MRAALFVLSQTLSAKQELLANASATGSGRRKSGRWAAVEGYNCMKYGEILPAKLFSNFKNKTSRDCKNKKNILRITYFL